MVEHSRFEFIVIFRNGKLGLRSKVIEYHNHRSKVIEYHNHRRKVIDFHNHRSKSCVNFLRKLQLRIYYDVIKFVSQFILKLATDVTTCQPPNFVIDLVLCIFTHMYDS